MKTLMGLSWWLSFSLFLIFFALSASSHKIPRLSAHNERKLEEPHDNYAVMEEFETFFYNQTIDHFNYKPESYATFKQRYVLNSKYWGGANTSSPIFVYLGEEESIDADLQIIGFLPENAPQFKALQVFIEHQFYGDSIPFGSSVEEAMKNKSTRGYFNSAQAIADYAEVILYIKKSLYAENSPVIVFGASYGGLLASWFRLKYPHVALGALASSAPILYFDDITPQSGWYSGVTKDFREASETCYETIRASWSEIDYMASQQNSLASLSQKFNSCRPLTKSSQLKDYPDGFYSQVAQYDAPPRYPVTVLCGGIDGAGGDNVLDKVFAGIVAVWGNLSCFPINNNDDSQEEGTSQWGWQTCSDLIIPIGNDNNETMFPIEPFNLTSYTFYCESTYGVAPRPNWVTTYFGGHSAKNVLRRFGSNIIFSNGLRDPWSIGGVLEDISDSIHAVYTSNGSHCLDVLRTTDTDPEWLVMQRKKQVEIIQGWITSYYIDNPALQN